MGDEISLSGKLREIDKLLDEFQETLDKETWIPPAQPGEMECNIGKLFLDEKKEELAIRAFTEAVKQGHPLAMVKLGCIYVDRNNMVKAFQLFLRAAELGDVTAMHYTAICYERGLGTNKNPGEAQEWERKYQEAKEAKAKGSS